MIKKVYFLLICMIVLFVACQGGIIFKYKNLEPTQWGEKVTGVKTKLKTDDRVIALTFDACGGKTGSGYDKELIDYLLKEKIPATLFINYRWIKKNQSVFLSLSKNPLFEIANHGSEHKPLSVNGKSAYGIKEVCLTAVPGSIIIAHMNHPEKETAEGMKLVIPELKKRGFKFVKLSDYPLK